MAHGYLNLFAYEKATIYSAGIETHGLNPNAVAIMHEDDVDITQHTSNLVTEYEGVDFDYIITVCDHANENCPFIPSKNAKRLHHNFSDPSKRTGNVVEKYRAFVSTRDEIKSYCKVFVEEYL